jgi:hypothetical protein
MTANSEEGYKPEGYEGSFEELLDDLHKLSGEQLKSQVCVNAPDGTGEHGDGREIYDCVALEFNESNGLPYFCAYVQ